MRDVERGCEIERDRKEKGKSVTVHGRKRKDLK